MEQSASEEKSTNNLWTDQLNKIEHVRSTEKSVRKDLAENIQELAEKVKLQKERNIKKGRVGWSKRVRAEDKALKALKNKY